MDINLSAMCLICYGVTAGATGLGGLVAPSVADLPAAPMAPPATVRSIDQLASAPVQLQRPSQTPKIAGTNCPKPGLKRDATEATFICKKKGKKLVWVERKPVSTTPAATTTPTVTDSKPKGSFSAASTSSNPNECKISNQSGRAEVTTGFSVTPERLPRAGQISVHVIFVDFPDYPGSPSSISTQADVNRVIATNRMYAAMSNNQVKFDWKTLPTYVRMPRNAAEYNIARGTPNVDYLLVQEAVNLADPVWDFRGAHMIAVVTNPAVPEAVMGISPALPRPPSSPINTAEGPVLNATLQTGDAHRVGGPILIHEIGHLFGLMDHYNFDWRRGQEFSQQFAHLGSHDFMNHASGYAPELMGWNRWLLGWVSDEQVHCVTVPSTTDIWLRPINSASGTRMAVVKLSNNRAIAVESKRQGEYCRSCKAGVLVYELDSSKRSGYGPMRILRKPTSVDPWYDDAFLAQDESLSHEGWTITNLETGAFGDVVRIART